MRHAPDLITRTHIAVAAIALSASGFAARRLDAPGWVDNILDVAWVAVFLCAAWLVFRAWRRGEIDLSADGDGAVRAFVYIRNACLAGLAAFLVFYVASSLWSGGNILDGGGNLALAAEWFLKACFAVLVVLWMPLLLIGLATSVAGITILFAAAFTLVTAVPSLATILAADFLYPESVASAGWTGLLWLIIPASLATVILFDFLLDEITPRSLRGRIQSEPSLKIAETAMRGVFITLMLIAASRLVPDAAGVSVVAAFAAGMFATFVRYYLGFYLDDSGEAGLLVEEFADELD